jgi:hypothetical protein
MSVVQAEGFAVQTQRMRHLAREYYFLYPTVAAWVRLGSPDLHVHGPSRGRRCGSPEPRATAADTQLLMAADREYPASFSPGIDSDPDSDPDPDPDPDGLEPGGRRAVARGERSEPWENGGSI